MSQSREKYGMLWRSGESDLDIELWCYAKDHRPENTRGRLSRWDHFKNAVDLIWNTPESTRKVIWNDWTERMLKAMIYNKYVGLAGAGSSGKSDAAALFCLVEFFSAPTLTLCLLLSTTLTGAKKRVWKSVEELWNAAEAQWIEKGMQPIGKLVNSRNMLMGMDKNGKWTETTGLCLIAADKDNEKEAAKKLKGLKPPSSGGRLRMVADEFSDLGDSILTAMIGNLNTTSGFKGIGMSNPGSKLTPFARFVKPKAGWSSLKLGMQEWETEYGVCLSFDSYYSPRMLTPELEQEDGTHALYDWMPSAQSIEQAKSAMGEDSVEFWAQFRGMFCPVGAERTVWSEAELVEAMEPVDENDWDPGVQRVRICALDPAFVTGGDRAVMMWGECGRVRGRKVMNILGWEVVQETSGDADDNDGDNDAAVQTVSENVIDTFRSKAREVHALPNRCGFDATGGGVVFGQWLWTKWSQSVRAVNFGGAPVERRADSQQDHEIYAYRVDQLWVQPKALVRRRQIFGIPYEAAEELCMRKFDPKHNGSKIRVESKKDMKKRTGKSPDVADTFVTLVEVAIENGLLDFEEIRRDDRKQHQQWQNRVLKSMSFSTNMGERKSLVAKPMPKRLTYNRHR